MYVLYKNNGGLLAVSLDIKSYLRATKQNIMAAGFQGTFCNVFLNTVKLLNNGINRLGPTNYSVIKCFLSRRGRKNGVRYPGLYPLSVIRRIPSNEGFVIERFYRIRQLFWDIRHFCLKQNCFQNLIYVSWVYHVFVFTPSPEEFILAFSSYERALP